MARKSVPGSRTRPTSGKEQIAGENAANPREVKAMVIAQEPASEEKRNQQPEAAPVAKEAAEPRKMEVVKTEPRKNVVPINLDDEIRRRAYEIYQERGSRSGGEAEDWLAAEREVRQRYRPQSA